MNARLWKSSAAYRSGYADGKADGIEHEKGQRAFRPVQIRMEDGKFLFTRDVLVALREAGWRLLPIEEEARDEPA